MYHPAGEGPGTPFEDENFEFIELQNFGSETVDLTGFELEGVIDFRFTETNALRFLPAGSRLLLVENAAAFNQRYPTLGPVAGTYRNRLDNGSGRLALFGPLREPVFDFRYSDEWQPTTDGTGPSLVLREETRGSLYPADAANWRSSSRPFGSPGALDPPPLRLTTELLDDALHIHLIGESGQTYILEQMTALGRGWQPADSKKAGVDGIVTFSILPVSTQRLFRVLEP